MYLSENVYLLKLRIKMFEVDVDNYQLFSTAAIFPTFPLLKT